MGHNGFDCLCGLVCSSEGFLGAPEPAKVKTLGAFVVLSPAFSCMHIGQKERDRNWCNVLQTWEWLVHGFAVPYVRVELTTYGLRKVGCSANGKGSKLRFSNVIFFS